MSLKAMLWVMERAPVKSHTELAVLYALADRANDTGDAAYPSQDWIADKARCSVRTVRRTLNNLQTAGVISHGDQRHVAHIRPDRRPTVWQLHLHLDRTHQPPTATTAPGTTPTTGQDGHPSGTPNHTTGGQNDRPLGESRADTGGTTTGHHGSSDRTPRVERPDTAVSDEPSLTHQNPPRTIPPLSPQGDDAADTDAQILFDPSEVVAVTPQDSRPLPAVQEPSTAPAVQEPDSKRGRRLSEEWWPSADAVEKIRQHYPGMTREILRREFDKFQNHWLSSSGANARKRDWDRTWINWMHTAVDRMSPRERTTMYAPPGQPVTITTTGVPSKQQQAHDIAAQLAAEFASMEPRS